MRIETKINLICTVLIFLSIIATTYFVLFNKKMGGNILNEGSEIVNGEYYIVDDFGNKNKITQDEWEKSKYVTILFFIIVTLGSISIFYLFCRYIFIPSFTDNIHSIIKFLSKRKK